MARPRRQESAYQRRIRLYLERHPGATRQQARGKQPGFEYQQRIERAQQRSPGISRRQAAGHGTRDERQLQALLRAIRKAGRNEPDTIVSFLGLDRQPDGTWNRAGFDLLDGEMLSFDFGGDALARLPEVADAVSAAGLMLLGAKYLQMMIDYVQEHLPSFRAKRNDRWFRRFDRLGRALTAGQRKQAGIVSDPDQLELLRAKRFRLLRVT